MSDSKVHDFAISVVGATKSFDRRYVGGGYTTLKTQLIQLFRRKGYKETMQRTRIDVLRGVSFDIRRGEVVGIIGRNGAGKSTMLKLLTGIYEPTAGTVTRRGRVSALLELGAGFHPEFSGRENIYVNGMILGLSRKELQKREQAIIDFAEMQEFIDAPVRTYSSGMFMRLAFSVAVNVDPDILIIDEILAVGDDHFQRKSKAKLDEFKSKNIAIVLVTHSLDTVEQWCTRAIWLHEGKVEEDGDPTRVVNAYRSQVRAEEKEQLQAEKSSFAPIVELLAEDGTVRTVAPFAKRFSLRVKWRQRPEAPAVSLRLRIKTADGTELHTTAPLLLDAAESNLGTETCSKVCHFSQLNLPVRSISIGVDLLSPDQQVLQPFNDVARFVLDDGARIAAAEQLESYWK
jgi:lipopolysaccharide transport system ATP-binding protein